MYRLEIASLTDKQTLRETEYLLTNGLGGYASSTITGCHTRKYHGILVAALNPPVERFMTVSKLSETICVENTEIQLKSYDSSANQSYETDCLKTFEKDYGVHLTYELPNGLTLKKSLYLRQGENTALVRYEIVSPVSGSLKLSPELSIRDHHEVSTPKDEAPTWSDEEAFVQMNSCHLADGLKMALRSDASEALSAVLSPVQQWTGPYYLANEAERGLQETDYAYVPFQWQIDFKANQPLSFNVVITTEKQLPQVEPPIMIRQIKAHYEALLLKGREKGQALPAALKSAQEALVLAASDFIVNRASTGKSTILAGYPWFTDWGRDSMISLSGLTLSAGRPEMFREIYETFERYMKDGILPNVFPDKGDEPRYNTVDATLWMPIAMLRYYEETQDIDYVKKHFLPTLQQIITHYSKGTLNNTYMDTDGLIWSGDESTQLTWMDVKVNGWVVTPRHGKAVEINALWYNTLQIGYFFNIMCNEAENEVAKDWILLAEKVKESFSNTFWNESGGYLYDVVRNEEKLNTIRPNQLFALSLPYPLLEEKRAQSVLEVVKLHLWMPYGLRSLSPMDAEYHGYYGGDVLSRDGAYHRGTGWGWLIGPFLDAFYSVETANGKSKIEVLEAIEAIILKACTHLETICLGQFCENFDGDEPFHGRGCMAQAWSVAELLRWVAKINDFRLRRQLHEANNNDSN